MTMLRATIKAGRLELDVPPDWPDGTEVEIHPVEPGIEGDSGIMSPEEIAKTLEAMDNMEALEMSEAERAAWEADRQSRTAREKAEFMERAEKLRRLWE